VRIRHHLLRPRPRVAQDPLCLRGRSVDRLRGFGVGALRTPATPMSDQELSKAIADFLRDAPSAEAVSNLGRRFDPSSGV